MTVNSTNVKNNETLITTASTATIAGGSLAVAGYNSKPWLKDGLPSDSFIKNIENRIVRKTDKTIVKALRAFDKYKSEIIKSNTIDNLVDANINFYADCAGGKSFGEIKKACRTNMMATLKNGMVPDGDIDIALDYINDIDSTSNLRQLKNVMMEQIEFSNYGCSFSKIKKRVGEKLEQLQDIWGLKNFNQSAKEAVNAVYDVKNQKFISKENEVSKELFIMVKKAAKGIQTRTAVLCGIMGAAVFGSAVYVIKKFGKEKK